MIRREGHLDSDTPRSRHHPRILRLEIVTMASPTSRDGRNIGRRIRYQELMGRRRKVDT